ncbi:MAG: hypothetical protein ACREI3_08420, partial [Nitrospirales bacterium]
GTANGVYQLEAKGTRWVPVTEGLGQTLVPSLAMTKDGTLFAGTSGKGIMRYRIKDAAWKRMERGLRDHEGLIENFVRVLAVDKEQAVYAGTFDGGVFRSTDLGESWRPISRALPNDSIRGIVPSEKALYVATGRGVFKTATKGKTWKWVALNEGLTQLSVQTFIQDEAGRLYVGTTSGVFRSDDEGVNWSETSTGLRPTPSSR